ncbi:MAG: ATP-binding protein [Sterolibacterium sp.]
MLAKDRADKFLDAAAFQERASRYVADHPEMICINWVDANYLITDVAPIAPNKQIVGLRLSLPEPKRASRLAMEMRQPVYTHPFQVVQGELAFELWVPVFHGDAFLGLFGGIYSYEKLLHSLVAPQLLKTTAMSVADVTGRLLWALPLAGTVDEKLVHHVPLPPPENGIVLRFAGYGRDPIEWRALALEFLCLALVLGMACAMWGLKREIEVRKRAEKEIRKLHQELEQRVAERTAQMESANKELETFAYSVSHDLRAPLRHIDGFLELLKERIDPALDAESRRYMSVISEAALRMSTLIDDLLSFSRMGHAEMARTQVDLTALVQEVIREFEPETQGRAVHWRIAELPEVGGDRAMLRVALTNLIENALKFTRPRAQAEIEIGCALDDETETIVFVRDNGVGFDMQYVDKLFGVFERLHSVHEFGGTGIGLANVRQVIDRHGGRTWAEGKIDEGATFYFSLPRPASKEIIGEKP